MKRFLKYSLLLSVGILALSCAKRAEEPIDASIGFEVEETKAFIGSVAAMSYNGSAFEVNAAYSEGDSFNSGSAFHFMERCVVEYDDGVWTYSPKAYWLPGNCYRFRAIYPANVVTNLTDDLLEDGVSFDYSTPSAQASQSDLMLSSLIEEVTPSPLSSVNPGIGLHFTHILSTIRLEAKIADASNDDFKIISAQITGMKDSGTYSSGAWDVSAGSVMTCSANTFAGDGILAKGEWTSLFGDGLLLIPQDITDGVIKLRLDYITTHDGDDHDMSSTILFPAPSGNAWIPGKIYNYKLEMQEDTEDIIIIFDESIMTDWADDNEDGVYDFQP